MSAHLNEQLGLALASFEQAQDFRHDEDHSPSVLGRCRGWCSGGLQSSRTTSLREGVRTVPTLAFVAKTEEELDRHLIQPLFAGLHPRDPEVWSPQPGAAYSPGYHACTCGTLAGSCGRFPCTPPTTSTPPAQRHRQHLRLRLTRRCPKQLPTGVWSTLLQAYNKAQLHGVDRSFPNMRSWGRRWS